MLAQSGSGVAAAKTVGAQCQVGTPLWDKGPNALGHSTHIVAGGQNGTLALRELLGDERQLRGAVGLVRIFFKQPAVEVTVPVPRQFAPAGDAEYGDRIALLAQILARLDHFGQDGARPH